MKNLLHKLFNDFGGGRQGGGFVLGLAGFQDGDEIKPAVGQVLTHAKEEAVEVVTQLDWLTRTKKKIHLNGQGGGGNREGAEVIKHHSECSFRGSHLIWRKVEIN